jgi:hypothetical protein
MFHLSWGFKPLLNGSLLNSRSLMKPDTLTPLGRGQRFGQHSFYLLHKSPLPFLVSAARRWE